MIYNDEYVRIERFLEKYIDDSIKVQDCNFYIGIKDTLPEPYREYPPLIRVGLRSSKVNRKGQEQIKEWFKNTFDLDKPQLEREYSRSNKEILYEILYKVPEELYDKLKVLSRVA
ncbi:MAG: hypothetical protein J5691_00800 [Bacilli bacterium]|nr:hypothetical protein [Bacilli bacterium]